MDESARSHQALSYTERDVTALLDFEGGLLYLYFSLMLGDELSATRALGDTIIAALPDTNYRRLFTIARTVCRQYRSVPAALDARPMDSSLTGVSIAALQRLEPEDREICVLGAPRYRLNDRDLATVLGTRTVASLRRKASARFDWAVKACAVGAGLGVSEDLPARALRSFGSETVTLPYAQIVPLATDPVLEGLREGIRARVALPVEAAPAAERPLEALGNRPRAANATGPLVGRSSRAAAWPHLTITPTEVKESEQPTAPLRLVPARHSRRANARRRMVAATVVAAGAIPAAIAGVAFAGHSLHHGSRDSAGSPLLEVPGSPAQHAASAPAKKHYTPRHAKPPVKGAAASAASGGSTYDTNMTAMPSGTTASAGVSSTSTASTSTGSSTTASSSTSKASSSSSKASTSSSSTSKTSSSKASSSSSKAPPSTSTPPVTSPPTTTTHGNGNGPKTPPPGQVKKQGQNQNQNQGNGQGQNQGNGPGQNQGNGQGQIQGNGQGQSQNQQ